ncbi:hypothetical protein CSV77_05775 [Sporosarcina sp. P16b]|nr:hypothetical protein CSV77_05775 [Sporosarcina sp. P16b]
MDGVLLLGYASQNGTGRKTLVGCGAYNKDDWQQLQQFGKEVLCTLIHFSMLEAMFEIDHEVQRQLDPRKRKDIRDFILDSLKKGSRFTFPHLCSLVEGIYKK